MRASGRGYGVVFLLALLASAVACDKAGKLDAEGQKLLQNGKAAEAEALFRSAVVADPKLVAARLDLGRALAAEEKHQEAIAETSMAIDPATGATPEQAAEGRRLMGQSYLAIGQAAMKAGKLQSALATLQKASDLAPGPASDAALGAALVALGHNDEGAARLEKALEGEAKPDADTLLSLATAYVNASKNDKAEATLKRGIAEHPKVFSFYDRLARQKAAVGERGQAADVLVGYLDQDPKAEGVYESITDLLSAPKDTERRRAVLARWRKANPTSEQACLRTGTEFAVDRPEVALAELRACLDTVPNLDALYDDIVDLMLPKPAVAARRPLRPGARGPAKPTPAAAMPPLHYDRVLEFLDEEIRRHPDRMRLIDLKAQVLVKASKRKEAEEMLDALIAARPDKAASYLAKARFLESVGKPDNAKGMIDTAREKEPLSRDVVRFAVGFDTRQKQWDAVEGQLGTMRELGASEEEVESLREMSSFARSDVSCVKVGQGPGRASMERVIPFEDIHEQKGLWSGAAVQNGYVMNTCKRVTVNAVVIVSFNVVEVTQISIFVDRRRKTTSRTFSFKGLKPGEAKPFAASTNLSALEFGSGSGTLGGFGTSEHVTGVSVTVKVISPVL